MWKSCKSCKNELSFKLYILNRYAHTHFHYTISWILRLKVEELKTFIRFSKNEDRILTLSLFFLAFPNFLNSVLGYNEHKTRLISFSLKSSDRLKPIFGNV